MLHRLWRSIRPPTRLAYLLLAIVPAVAVVATPGTAYANTLYPNGCQTAASGSWNLTCWAGENYVNRANLVTAVQRMVLGEGCNPGGIDGQFGPNTQAAVECFQNEMGIGVDGKVGPVTWGTFNGHLSNPTYYGPDQVVWSEGSQKDIILQEPNLNEWFVEGLHGTYVRMNTSGPN